MVLADGESVRIFVRTGGDESVQPGFSLGIMRDTPVEPVLSAEAEGIRFYMEQSNLWVLDGRDLTIRLDEHLNEVRLVVS